MTAPNHLSLEQKLAFIQMAAAADSPFSEVCRAFRISRQTGYKWRRRFRRLGLAGLADQSRRPHFSPQAAAAVWVERLRVARPRAFGQHLGAAFAAAGLVAHPAVPAAWPGAGVASTAPGAAAQ
jgi:transposase-like protein